MEIDRLIQELRKRCLFSECLDENFVEELISNLEMLKFFNNFIHVEEEDMTPYKHKLAYYNKKAHYINGRKINRETYRALKHWKSENEEN